VLYETKMTLTTEAEAWYRRAILLNPRHSFATYNLATMLGALKDPPITQVIDLLEHAVEISPDDPLPAMDLGLYYLRAAGKKHDATRLLRKAQRSGRLDGSRLRQCVASLSEIEAGAR
jgi:Flp pilus assembly protein TadD